MKHVTPAPGDSHGTAVPSDVTPVGQRRKFGWGSAAIALTLIAAGVVVWALMRPGDVAMPAEDASPTEVVATYIEAVNARDCATADALWLTDAMSTGSWCSEATLRDAEVSQDPDSIDPAWVGLPTGTQVVSVQVTFGLNWKILRNDGSLSEGPTQWGYTLRQDSFGQWRLMDQGVG